MTDEQIICALGGNRVVADRLKLTERAVSHWRKRGIPWQHRHKIKLYAKARKVALPDDFLYRKGV